MTNGTFEWSHHRPRPSPRSVPQPETSRRAARCREEDRQWCLCVRFLCLGKEGDPCRPDRVWTGRRARYHPALGPPLTRDALRETVTRAADARDHLTSWAHGPGPQWAHRQYGRRHCPSWSLRANMVRYPVGSCSPLRRGSIGSKEGIKRFRGEGKGDTAPGPLVVCLGLSTVYVHWFSFVPSQSSRWSAYTQIGLRDPPSVLWGE